MWTWFILLLQYGPALIKLIREIFGLIDDLTPDEKKAAEAELMQAHSAYKTFKDRKPLDDLRDRLKRKREERRCRD